MWTSLRNLLIATLLVGSVDAAPTISSRIGNSSKTDASARSHVMTVLNTAIKTLTDEWQAHQKDATAALRPKSNYFTDNPAPDLPDDAVLSTLSRNYGTVSETCYVRWQLLSFFDPAGDKDKLMQIAPQIGTLYGQAPAPLAHPSLIPGVRNSVDREISRLTADDANNVNDVWDKKLAAWVEDNRPIVGYSDALFALLPESFGKYKLGWSDMFDRRMPAGVSCADMFGTVQNDLATWATTAAVPERRSMAQAISRTAERIGKDYPPMLYTQVAADDQTHRLKFQQMPSDSISKPALTALATGVASGSVTLPAAK